MSYAYDVVPRYGAEIIEHVPRRWSPYSWQQLLGSYHRRWSRARAAR